MEKLQQKSSPEVSQGILNILESLKQEPLTAIADKTKESVEKNLYVSKLIEELETHLKKNYEGLRKNQKRTLNRLILFLKAGKLDGLIKQPTGAGKTRIIAETARAFSEPSLILVPRVSLVKQTYDEMVGNDDFGIEGIGFDSKEVRAISSDFKKSTQQQVVNFLSEKGDIPASLVMTYQTLVALEKGNPEAYKELMEYVKVIHTDEAHRSLGERTKAALKSKMIMKQI